MKKYFMTHGLLKLSYFQAIQPSLCLLGYLLNGLRRRPDNQLSITNVSMPVNGLN